eukprot:CAMPEP_0168461734 /NCGR_PEP_ID=MMETSP0228-20121227/54140_1 /TAXON_ID=133427 /ORGANISM="Protoceratium reticulatum, Strain CCCM 535 (=CCMP 1889)" /LENGTH=185 /DNA_ID=CAMNT_0008477063 /DNA_START=51 /DNA_END=605 /DNA_ORIENTATION=-
MKSSFDGIRAERVPRAPALCVPGPQEPPHVLAARGAATGRLAPQILQAQVAEMEAQLAEGLRQIAALKEDKVDVHRQRMEEIKALRVQLCTTTKEVVALRAAHESDNLQLHQAMVEIEGSLQSTRDEVQAWSAQARAQQAQGVQRMASMEQTLEGLCSTLEASGREGQSQAAIIRDDIGRLRGAI